MLKKMRFMFYVILLFAIKNAYAESIYTFDGQITLVWGPSGGATISTYEPLGIFNGGNLNLSVLLDSDKQGFYTTSNGTKIYPSSYGVGSWPRYASLLSSNIDMNQPATNGISYQYGDTVSSHFFGGINVGAQLSIWKYSDYGDFSAFVENWKVGDSVSFSFDFDNGNGRVRSLGTATLTGVSNPLPGITGFDVPLPSSLYLLSSGLLMLGIHSRKKAK